MVASFTPDHFTPDPNHHFHCGGTITAGIIRKEPIIAVFNQGFVVLKKRRLQRLQNKIEYNILSERNTL